MLTQHLLKQFKQNYAVYKRTTVVDDYGEEHIERNSAPAFYINTMFNILSDNTDFAQYGESIKYMLYACVYEDVEFEHKDIVMIDDVEYEVVNIQTYHTHQRIDVQRKSVQ